MSLPTGTRLGPYQVLAPLGAGGMGEVYRAKDLNLDREVAIKILPDAVTHDPERLARLEREAKVLASLNHPNIDPDVGDSRPEQKGEQWTNASLCMTYGVERATLIAITSAPTFRTCLIVLRAVAHSRVRPTPAEPG